MGVEQIFMCFKCKEYMWIGKFHGNTFQGPYNEDMDDFMGMRPVFEWLLKHTHHTLQFSSDVHILDAELKDDGWREAQ